MWKPRVVMPRSPSGHALRNLHARPFNRVFVAGWLACTVKGSTTRAENLTIHFSFYLTLVRFSSCWMSWEGLKCHEKTWISVKDKSQVKERSYWGWNLIFCFYALVIFLWGWLPRREFDFFKGHVLLGKRMKGSAARGLESPCLFVHITFVGFFQPKYQEQF